MGGPRIPRRVFTVGPGRGRPPRPLRSPAGRSRPSNRGETRTRFGAFADPRRAGSAPDRLTRIRAEPPADPDPILFPGNRRRLPAPAGPAAAPVLPVGHACRGRARSRAMGDLHVRGPWPIPCRGSRTWTRVMSDPVPGGTYMYVDRGRFRVEGHVHGRGSCPIPCHGGVTCTWAVADSVPGVAYMDAGHVRSRAMGDLHVRGPWPIPCHGACPCNQAVTRHAPRHSHVYMADVCIRIMTWSRVQRPLPQSCPGVATHPGSAPAGVSRCVSADSPDVDVTAPAQALEASRRMTLRTGPPMIGQGSANREEP